MSIKAKPIMVNGDEKRIAISAHTKNWDEDFLWLSYVEAMQLIKAVTKALEKASKS